MDTTEFESVERQRAPEQVVDQLRNAITSGSLRPGQRLQQADLAKRLGVSRMPIREALRTLEREGLVELQPYRGAVVANLSSDELREIYEIRIALETLAVRTGVPMMEASDLAALDRELASMDDAEDSAAWLRHNARFHELLYASSGRSLLLETIDNLRHKSDRFLGLFATTRDRTFAAQEEHRAIFERCRAADADGAARLLAAHLRHTVASLAPVLDDANDDVSPPEPSPESKE